MTELAVRPVLWMLASALAFASMGACASALGGRCDWLVIALVRALFMFASTAFLARRAGVRLVVWDPPKLWVRSVAGSFSLVCNFYAMTRLPIADVLTLTNAYPLWIILLTSLGARRVPTGAEALGVASGMQSIVSGVTWAHYYGRRGLGRIQGTATMVTITGAAIGPLPVAYLQQRTGTYTSGVLAMAALTLAAAVVVALNRARPQGH